MFESGAILLYLADKTGQFIARDPRARIDAIQWLFWQMGNLGPMAGQNNHFSNYAVEKIPYAMDRYRNEVNRLYGVLNKRLADRGFVAGDYSIADMAIYPWIVPYEQQGQKIEDFRTSSAGSRRSGRGRQWCAPTTRPSRSIRTRASAPPRSARSCSGRPPPRSSAPPRGRDGSSSRLSSPAAGTCEHRLPYRRKVGTAGARCCPPPLRLGADLRRRPPLAEVGKVGTALRRPRGER